MNLEIPIREPEKNEQDSTVTAEPTRTIFSKKLREIKNKMRELRNKKGAPQKDEDKKTDDFATTDSFSLPVHPISKALLDKRTALRELQNQEVILKKDDDRIDQLEDEIKEILASHNSQAETESEELGKAA